MQLISPINSGQVYNIRKQRKYGLQFRQVDDVKDGEH